MLACNDCIIAQWALASRASVAPRLNACFEEACHVGFLCFTSEPLWCCRERLAEWGWWGRIFLGFQGVQIAIRSLRDGWACSCWAVVHLGWLLCMTCGVELTPCCCGICYRVGRTKYIGRYFCVVVFLLLFKGFFHPSETVCT